MTAAPTDRTAEGLPPQGSPVPGRPALPPGRAAVPSSPPAPSHFRAGAGPASRSGRAQRGARTGRKLTGEALAADAGESPEPGRAVTQPAARPGQGGMVTLTAEAHCIRRCDWTTGPGPAAEIDRAAEKHAKAGHPTAVVAEPAQAQRRAG